MAHSIRASRRAIHQPADFPALATSESGLAETELVRANKVVVVMLRRLFCASQAGAVEGFRPAVDRQVVETRRPSDHPPSGD